MNPALKVFEGRDTYGNDRFATRYPDVMFTSKPARGTRRAVAFDYDSQAEHTETWKVLADSRRRNTLAAVENLVHYSSGWKTHKTTATWSHWETRHARSWDEDHGRRYRVPHHADARMKAGELELGGSSFGLACCRAAGPIACSSHLPPAIARRACVLLCVLQSHDVVRRCACRQITVLNA